MSNQKTTLVKVQFGSAGYQECKRNVRERDGSISGQKLASEIFSYLFEGFKKEMKNQGYSTTVIQRVMFEEAIDYQIKIAINAMIEQLRRGKIAKFVPFDTYHETSKVE